jgi:hypothetical protein
MLPGHQRTTATALRARFEHTAIDHTGEQHHVVIDHGPFRQVEMRAQAFAQATIGTAIGSFVPAI